MFLFFFQSGESPSRKRRRTDVFDPAAVESLTPVELRFRNLVASGPGTRSQAPDLVPANSPRHEENANSNSPVGWRRSGPQVSVLQISPSSDLEVTIQVAEGANGNVTNSSGRRLSQLSPVFVVNGSMSGVTFIGQAPSGEMVASETDLIHEIPNPPHHGHLPRQSSGSSAQGVNAAALWPDNNNSNNGSNRRSVITHAASSGANAALTHDRNNNPLNENIGNTDSTLSDAVITSHLHENSKGQEHFSSQSSSASVESLTDADAQSIDNGSQMSDTQSIDSTAATIDSTSEASLAVFRGPVATSASSAADMSNGYRHQAHHSQGVPAFVEDNTQQILQLQAAAYRERSQSQSSQASSVSSSRVPLQQCPNNVNTAQQNSPPNASLQLASVATGENQSPSQQNHLVNLPTASGLRSQVILSFYDVLKMLTFLFHL